LRQTAPHNIVGAELEQKHLSLVDAVSSFDFDTKLARVEERWNKLERNSRRVVPRECIIPEFYSWFVTEKSDVVRSSMIVSVRKAAQLGDPLERFYTNASELTNNVLKLKIDRKPQSLPAFVDHARECAYEKNIERAFFRRGDWRLADALSSLEDISDSWSQKKQKSLVKKILEASCSLSALITEAAALHGGHKQGTSMASTALPSSGGTNIRKFEGSFIHQSFGCAHAHFEYGRGQIALPVGGHVANFSQGCFSLCGGMCK